MKYFITGGAGFIGSHMVDSLINKGQVTVYDNLSSGKLDFIKEHLDKPNLQFIEGDCGDLAHLKKAMAGHDLAIHYASNPDIARGFFETDLDIREGTILTYNVLEAMRTSGVSRILYTSGSGIYGDVGTTPTPEGFGPLLPISFYGASKLACEGLISAFCYQFDMQGYILRMGNVVGRRQTHGVGFDFINKLKEDPSRLEILGDGTQQKSYVHVSDVINAHLFVAANTKDVVNVFNLATDDTLDVTSIARIVLEEMELKDTELAYTGGDRGWKGDVPQVRLPAKKLKALGWSCAHNSSQSVRRSVREMLGKGVGMQLAILAGGLGTRLGPLTAKTPKSLVPVLGKPFLERQIELVRGAGVKRLVLCIGHYGEQIVERFGDGSAYGVEIAYSREGKELLGTGGALKNARHLLDDAFMMMWGDSFLFLDYADIWRTFQEQDLPAMMVIYRNENLRVPSNVVVQDGKVAVYDKWVEDPDKVYIDEGLTCLRKDVLQRVPTGQPFAIEQAFRELATEGKLAAYETSQPFYEIGSLEGIVELESVLQEQEGRA